MTWLGADLTRDIFQSGAEMTRGRGSSGVDVSEFRWNLARF